MPLHHTTDPVKRAFHIAAHAAKKADQEGCSPTDKTGLFHLISQRRVFDETFHSALSELQLAYMQEDQEE